jgi:hypothetical protein
MVPETPTRRIGPDLVSVAATASPLVVSEEPKAAAVHAWVAKFSSAEKDELLARMITGDTALAISALTRKCSLRSWRGCLE